MSLMLPALARMRDERLRSTCANNLKQIGLSLNMYTSEARGEVYPPTSFYNEQPVDCDSMGYPVLEDKITFFTNSMYMPAVYPEYINDPNLFVCPGDYEGYGEWWANYMERGSLMLRACAARTDVALR
ncbi:MAG: hypothetical protein VCB26_04180 [Candidatus Hydrogenedentota bacterium]